MSFHHNLAQWQSLCLTENCPICRELPNDPGSLDVHMFEFSWLVAVERVCLKGTCLLLAKPHAIELYDLTDAELLGFMKEAQVSARVLKEVTGAVKINYEIHGNTVPHLHMHLFPRYMDDPFPGEPIDYRRVEPSVYQGVDFVRFVQDLQAKLAHITSV